MSSPGSRIFVDVGGYRGTSTLAALDPIFKFDKIYCFEPVPYLASGIRERIPSHRLEVIAAALSDRDGSAILYHAGSLAGSIFQDAPEYGPHDGQIEIRLIDAASFFASHIKPQDFVRIKFNCEGSESSIIRRLLERRLEHFLSGALVDFDADKIRSLAGVADGLRCELANRGVQFFEPPEVQYGMVTNFGGVRNWLLRSGAASPGLTGRAGSILYNLLLLLMNHEVIGYHKIRILRALALRR